MDAFTGHVVGSDDAVTDEVIGLITQFDRDYEQISRAVAADPRISVALELATRTTGRSFALTDHDGTVIDSSGVASLRTSARATVHMGDSSITAIDGWWRMAIPSARHPKALWMERTGDSTDASALLLLAGLRQTVIHFDHVRWAGQRSTIAMKSRLAELMIAETPTPELDELAIELGIDLDRPHRIVLVRRCRSGIEDGPTTALIDRLMPCALVTRSDDDVVLVANDLDALEREMRSLLERGAPLPASIGISSIASNGRDLSSFVTEARIAGNCAGWNSSIGLGRFEELDLIDVVTSNVDALLARRIIDDQLGELIDYDECHSSELLSTLRAWLESNDSLDRVAAAVHIHRNTLTYRLARVRTLLDVDLSNATVQRDLRLALRLLERHGSRPTSSPVAVG